MAVYTNPERPFLSVVIVVVAFTLVNLPSVSCWAGFGMAHARLPRRSDRGSNGSTSRWASLLAATHLADAQLEQGRSPASPASARRSRAP